MNCFACSCDAESLDVHADTALKSARLVLVASQNVTSIVPIPGIGPVTSVLIELIDKITVYILPIFHYVFAALADYCSPRKQGQITRVSRRWRAKSHIS